MTQLDGLERMGLVTRRSDPHYEVQLLRHALFEIIGASKTAARVSELLDPETIRPCALFLTAWSPRSRTWRRACAAFTTTPSSQ